MLAEGLDCETYLDTGNRAAFANAGPVMDPHADFARGIWAAEACAELVVDGPRLAAARLALACPDARLEGGEAARGHG